jgi:hypothetical protein
MDLAYSVWAATDDRQGLADQGPCRLDGAPTCLRQVLIHRGRW